MVRGRGRVLLGALGRPGQWQELETHGERPIPVRQMALGSDPDANELTVFGGEVLAYMAGQGKDAKDFPVNEIWVLELDSGTWTEFF